MKLIRFAAIIFAIILFVVTNVQSTDIEVTADGSLSMGLSNPTKSTPSRKGKRGLRKPHISSAEWISSDLDESRHMTILAEGRGFRTITRTKFNIAIPSDVIVSVQMESKSRILITLIGEIQEFTAKLTHITAVNTMGENSKDAWVYLPGDGVPITNSSQSL